MLAGCGLIPPRPIRLPAPAGTGTSPALLRLEADLRAIIRLHGRQEEGVAVALFDPATGDSLLIDAHRRMQGCPGGCRWPTAHAGMAALRAAMAEGGAAGEEGMVERPGGTPYLLVVLVDGRWRGEVEALRRHLARRTRYQLAPGSASAVLRRLHPLDALPLADPRAAAVHGAAHLARPVGETHVQQHVGRARQGGVPGGGAILVRQAGG